ncbi:hypothetical protein CAOG_06831 [Capsaspora owczarzaki ATCC 30864]|uniref:Uncharacterized protein n=1 Tax=Capsaspora owczarzaki (strain ATCC 30864) TaxID=595528 RepID=A0A0D2UNE1_CAPO3|nr:hypothetical protein CAOG_06831 [Capsaspora owczarzaki ATCC 30864]KJE96521.1 hypothetical protein CAOG_006831 [Capsaspora owczarzaki ATCC 30864]|eukprot:XP_004344452.2 hypothetical protein CAOG_06831 [Capsaspora owczarzaki ATCC 30864]
MCNQARMRIITVLLVLVLHVELALGDDAAVLDNDQLLSALGIPSNALDHVSLSRRPFNALVEPEVPVYTFTKFQSSKKNDHRVRQLETICTTECGSEATEECVRRCMCAPCYDELYASDPLEAGELDVRLQSFRSCVQLMIDQDVPIARRRLPPHLLEQGEAFKQQYAKRIETLP